MIKFAQFLNEHYVTTDSPEEKMKYHDAVHSMIKQSYKDIGGHAGLGYGTDEESRAITNDIKNPNHVMKLKKVAGKPVAVAIYRKQHGRKRMAVGTDGSDEGKKHLKRIMLDDHKDKRAWSESSGAMAAISKKLGVPTLPSSRAKELTGKEIKITSPEKYTRLIGGHEKEKELMGHPGKEWL